MQTIDLNSPPNSNPVPMTGSVIQQAPAYSQPVSSSNLKFQPDGFHTSASDPALQMKYGHRRELGIVQQNGNVVCGPPPIAASFSSPSPYNGGSQNVFSRYVAVDYATNTVMAPPPTYPGASTTSVQNPAPTSPSGFSTHQNSFTAPTAPPMPLQFNQSQSHSQHHLQSQSQSQYQFNVQPLPPRPPVGLAANIGGVGRGLGPPHVQVFNAPPVQEEHTGEVISMDSNSNSVM